MKTKPLGPFLGINTRLPDYSLRTKEGDFVKDAVNVDLLNDGSFRRRRSADIAQAMTAPHSLGHGYLVRASVLYKVTLPTYTETLASLLSTNDPMSYALEGDLYCTNGTDRLRITSAGTVYPWAMPTPAEPVVTQIAGTLKKGTYQVAVSYCNTTTGEESGVSASNNFHVSSDNAGLRITVPSATTGATHANIYVSTINGGVPFYQKQVALGGTTDVTALVAGREAVQRFEEPMPAGSRVFFFNGRMCVVNGKTLYYGLPYRHGYYLPLEGRIDFHEDIAIAVANQAGIYVATASQTFFFAGLSVAEIEAVQNPLPYGAVKGTEFMLPRIDQVGWFGRHGVVVADKHGQISPLMEKQVALSTVPASGVSGVFEDGDVVRVVSCGWCVNLSNGGATRYTGYDFTSYWGDFATSSDGLYNLRGVAKVPALVMLGTEDFSTERLKMVPAAYVGGEFGGPMELVVTTPKQGTYSYVARDYSPDMEMQRIDPGKGLKDNWYSFTLNNRDGFDFTLASVSFAPVASGRRI
ncbi:MAG: hypothetical protein E6R03_14535 [Hyphomicrobiaceae bacterium]|nr:MAG: hypothetical protein E6R03_14535 [Hyphomicrobiaceae bacterium]